MRVKVRTTKKDIAKGVRGNHKKCAFALALLRAIRKLGYAECSVGGWSASLYATADHSDTYPYQNVGPFYKLEWPETSKLALWIDAFDDGSEVKPFEVTLEIPMPGELTNA